MPSLFLRTLLVLALFAPAILAAKTVLCFGDSITRGYRLDEPYPDRLFLMLAGADVVINEGAPGETTSQRLGDLSASLARYRPSHVILLLGTNDINQKVSPSVIAGNLLSMAIRVRQAGALPIVVTVPPFVGWRSSSDFRVQSVNARIWANRNAGGYVVADVHAALSQNRQLMLSDGFHPSESGAHILTSIILEQLALLPFGRSNPSWSPELQSWLYPQDDQSLWSDDFKLLTVTDDPAWMYSSLFGWTHLGPYDGWVWTERMGWMKFEHAEDAVYLWSERLLSWMEVRADGTFYSFDYGWLVPTAMHDYLNPILGNLYFEENGGWVANGRFGWLWAARGTGGVWFWSEERQDWLGILPDGSIWSVKEQRVI